MEQASQPTEVQAEHQPLLQSTEPQEATTTAEHLPESDEPAEQQQAPAQSTEPTVTTATTTETTTVSSLDGTAEVSGSAEISVVSTEEMPATPSGAAAANLAEAVGNHMQTVIERGSSLLREWDSSGNDATATASGATTTTTTAEPTTSIGSPPPVVAPAVVLNETSEDSNATPSRVGVYPVATFVSNLVRTSVNEIRSHIPTVAVGAANHDDTMSLRSEPVGSMDILQNNNNDPNPSVADSSMTDQEFVLIDGDLVAIPASHHAPPPTPAPAQAERQYSHSENNIHHRMQQEQNAWYQPQQQQQQQHPQNQQQQQQHYYPPSDTDQTSYYTDSSYDHRQHHPEHFPNPRYSGGPQSERRDLKKGGKMSRSMRGFKKWIKKKSRRSNNKYAQEEYLQHSLQENRPSSSRHLMTSDDDDSIVQPPLNYAQGHHNASTAAAASAGTAAYGNRFEDEMSVASSITMTTNATMTAPSPTRPGKPEKKKKKNRFEMKKLKKQDKHPKKHAPLPPQQPTPPEASIALAPPPTLESFASVGSSSVDPSPSVASIPPAAMQTMSVASMPPPAAAAAMQPMSVASMPPAAAAAPSSAAAAMAPPSMPASSLFAEQDSQGNMMMMNRSASIAAEASFVGNADQLASAEVMAMDACVAEAYIEDRLDDYDYYDDDDEKKKKMMYYERSVVPKDADFKVDKMDAPNVESMLQRAGEFARDLENTVMESFCITKPAPPGPMPIKKKIVSQGKSDGGSVPLSCATLDDGQNVHNDILKIVMVGAETVDKQGLTRTLRNKSQKKKASSRKKTNTLGVDVHSWTPVNDQNAKFTIWTVRGNGTDPSDPYNTNFGAHPGTQSLFFSDRSLYLLVWDLAANNEKTYHREAQLDDSDSDSSSDDDEDYADNSNAYLREEANRQADRNLQTDIEERVLSWVDCIAQRGAHSAVLPVALVPAHMSPEETKRRCDILQTLLLEHTDKKLEGRYEPPKVLSGAETVHCVSLDTNMGIDLLEETIVAIANDVDHSVFDHVGTPVPKGTVQVLETSKRLKEADQKLVSLDLLMSALPPEEILSVHEVMVALEFLSSVGELFYFGNSATTTEENFDANNILTQFVILSRKWLVSALSCVLRNDLQRELNETRRFMNMQLLYSNQQFPENHAIQTLAGGSSSCPLLSSSDTEMLWQSMSFMREAADKSDQLSEHSTTSATMFQFLETLLVHTGIFLPLDIDRFAVTDYVYFVPSLLANGDAKSVWTYKSSEAYMTTLCHSWLFRDGAPVSLMEQVTVALLRDLYEFTHVVASTSSGDLKPASNHGSTLHRAQSFPLSQSAANDFIDSHDGDAIGGIRIHQINCWKSSLLVKIGCVFPEGNELRESFVEVFVSITDQSSPLCVSSDAMGARMQRLIVSGKGQVGHHGRKLWKGGYGIVMDSIKASVAHCTNVDRQVVCPECLAHVRPGSASTWSWDSVRAAAGTVVRCMKGHRVDSNLISGIPKMPTPKLEVSNQHTTQMPKKTVKDLLPSVVVVGLWDCESNVIRNVGSGFIVDRKLGLVITAGHILFPMEAGPNFGAPYFGLANAKAVIGVIRAGDDASSNARFRYFAEIVAEDIHNVDACVLRITSRMQEDVDNEALLGQQAENSMENCIADENLPALKLTRRYELEETIRILGYNQGGEGRLEQGKHVNRSADFAKGYICKQFKMLEDDNSDSDDESSCGECGFTPREEIVVMCPTISGHSGGPCVNDEGKVIGILSRADPVDRQRCYLAPTNELKSLVNKAKKNSSRATGGLKSSY